MKNRKTDGAILHRPISEIFNKLLVAVEALIESVNTTAGVNELLLTCEIGVAV